MNEQLIKALQSNNPVSVLEGLNVVRTEGLLTDINMIMQLSKSENPEIRKTANDVAADLILRNLIQYYSQIQTGVRESLGKLLQQLDPAVINRIGQTLYSEDEDTRLRAVQILGLLKQSTKIREVLCEIVKDSDTKVRATAVHLLGRIVLNKDMSLVLALLNDKDPRVRANTIESLEDIGNAGAIGLLHRFKKDPSNRIRGNVLKALWNLGYKNIIAELKDMMESDDRLMRASGAWVIGEIGKDNKELINLIASKAQDNDKLVRENVIKAQLKIGGGLAEKYLCYLCDEEEIKEVKKSMKR